MAFRGRPRFIAENRGLSLFIVVYSEIKTIQRDFNKLENPSPAQRAVMEYGINRQKEKIKKAVVEVMVRLN